MDITIKPHHLLDILKLYGKGIDIFVEDTQYHHNFYIIANSIVDKEVTHVHFTYGYDDICEPCRYLKNKCCIDTFAYNDKTYQKHYFNENIDQRLIDLLHIDMNQTYDFSEVISSWKKVVTLNIICQVWSMHSFKENVVRYQLIQKGINRFIEFKEN